MNNNNKANQENEQLEDFQIDEFAIHDGEWNEKTYSSDCSVIDGELYDKLLNLLEEHGIGEGKKSSNNSTQKDKHYYIILSSLSISFISIRRNCHT